MAKGSQAGEGHGVGGAKGSASGKDAAANKDGTGGKGKGTAIPSETKGKSMPSTASTPQLDSLTNLGYLPLREHADWRSPVTADRSARASAV